MFWNKEIEMLANSVIRFCKNRLRDLHNNLTVKNKEIFKKTICEIKRLKSEEKGENLSKIQNIGDICGDG